VLLFLRCIRTSGCTLFVRNYVYLLYIVMFLKW